MKRYYFKLNEEKDKDLIELIESIPRPFRGHFIIDSLRLGLDPIKDNHILEILPDLQKPYLRLSMVKKALEQFGKSVATPLKETGVSRYPAISNTL
ncbi:MAG TPA: hypothetical protein PK659_09300 [Methanothrix sp.]|nr:hypothetical protein [Methanothrix sp.]HOK07917.1 hypothetical protein [Syntrophales bacterium]HOL44434.1 hypothetical protein [Methanothrix sp.]